MLAPIEQLASWLVHPWLFVAGLAAVLLPIVIHLFKRRKVRVIEWAAMEFLRVADKKHRRRIRLENWLLLALRCLAVLLIGLLLARPFLPTSATGGLLETAPQERIILLDDSLSMQARMGNEAAWDIAIRRLQEYLANVAEQPGSNNLTVWLASQPDERLWSKTPLARTTVDEINTKLGNLAPRNGSGRLSEALQSIREYIVSQPANINRTLYVITDLRDHDWLAERSLSTASLLPEQKAGPSALLRELAGKLQSCVLMDVADDEDRNLTITEIRPEATLVQGTLARFDVMVLNQGSTAASDVRVRLSVGESLPLEATIDQLAPRETMSVRFQVMFDTGEPILQATDRLPPVRVKVELQTPQPGIDDRLAADSVAFFPARIVRGIPALIVDGDPSTQFGRAESFYLLRALSPVGPIASGIVPEVIAERDFDLAALDKYRVIFWLNASRLGDHANENRDRLTQWVQAGGGLVIMPGDQTDASWFNSQLWRDGDGLSPLKLAAIQGDELEAAWTNLQVANATHPVLRQFAGQNNPLLDSVKLFRWWRAAVTQQPDSEVSVLARLSDGDDSPAIAEKHLGAGRVMAFAIPADADWHNWPSNPSYVLLMQDLVQYLASDRDGRGVLRVGEPLRQSVDLTRYHLDAVLTGPHDLHVNLQAVAPAGTDDVPNKEATWQMEFPAVAAPGFYELKLARRDGGTEAMLFAANVDPAEGNLRRNRRPELERQFTGTKVTLIHAAQIPSLGQESSRSEFSWYLLWLLAAVLATEQVLGWYFGRARS